MIGVWVEDADRPVAAELFELFKTPWEFYTPGRRYDTVLVSRDVPVDGIQAALTVLYGTGPTEADRRRRLALRTLPRDHVLDMGGARIPLGLGAASFRESGPGNALPGTDRTAVTPRWIEGDRALRRAGFDLFGEVRRLLTEGQPPAHAERPTLELHVDLLRRWILEEGLPLVEIPPRPAGRPFTACLTHDVDFVRLRHHAFDHSMAGFVRRAGWEPLAGLARRQSGLRRVVQGWAAVLGMPFAALGLARDAWFRFDEWRRIEADRHSTFFFIPFRKRAGEGVPGPRPDWRAAKYDVRRLRPVLDRLREGGCEVGVHGIDAWRDAERGREERERVAGLCGDPAPGVRMHWLLLEPDAYARLEDAGFSYDSTLGYNEAAGFRGGTGQVFRPLGARRLLELPMAVMDTALFGDRRMRLDEEAAWGLCMDLMESLTRFGGVFTVNWHQHTLGPDRRWGGFYARLLENLRARRVWFACGRQAVDWFAARRDVAFRETGDGRAVRVEPSPSRGRVHPPLLVRTHARGPGRGAARNGRPLSPPAERSWDGTGRLEIAV